MAEFAHLHLHTDASLLDGAAQPSAVVEAVVRDGQRFVGVTDHGNMRNVPAMYSAAEKAGIGLVVGSEIYMARESVAERPNRGRKDDETAEGGGKLYYHLTAMAENEVGYKNLVQLSSRAYLEGFYYKPRVDWDMLSDHAEGVIVTTGCLGGIVLQHLLRGEEELAVAAASRLADIFGRNNVFVELQDHGLPEQKLTNPALLRIAGLVGLGLLATNDSHYVHRHEAPSHDALLCVSTGAKVADQHRFRFHGQEHYVKTAAEMHDLFDDWAPGACSNTLLVAERCAGVDIGIGAKPDMPSFPLPEGETSEAGYLERLVLEGAKKRWGENLPEVVSDRLAYELRTIGDMGFPGYFLIVWDLIRHAREIGVRVGTARGSAGGCAVAYCLRITDIDPIRYDLIFERFLNPSRVSMPDIDMDFDSRYRDDMIAYAVEKYGEDYTARICTTGRIKSRAAVRDAARVLGHPYKVGDELARSLPPTIAGRDTPLAACLELTAKHEAGHRAAGEFRRLYEGGGAYRATVDVALGLEGISRTEGVHAAALVITRLPVTNYLPVQRAPEPGAPIVTQYEMHGVEDLGLLKMDFLSLRNLDVISGTVELLRLAGQPVPDIDNCPLDDQATLDLLRRGDTVGVFQLESTPMRALLRALAPTCFEDVCAVLALYRPGPMKVNMHYDYADRKNGRESVEYFHPDAEDVLGDTYGLMIYQESVMRVAQRFAGYSLADADSLRRHCGKKIREAMAKERQKFEDGVEATGYGAGLGGELFDIIEGFADYAFPKAHSFGYGHTTWQTAYLKANHPVAYLAALLGSVKDKLAEKGSVYLAECRTMGIEVSGPDINVSGAQFTPDGQRIRFGLSCVRGVGEGVSEAIVAERINGAYVDHLDLARRVPSVTRATLSALGGAGAFDNLGLSRFDVLATLDAAQPVVVPPRSKGTAPLFAPAPVRAPRLGVDLPARERAALERHLLACELGEGPLTGKDPFAGGQANATVDRVGERGVVLVTLDSLEPGRTKTGNDKVEVLLRGHGGTIEAMATGRSLKLYGHFLCPAAIGAAMLVELSSVNDGERFFVNHVELVDPAALPAASSVTVDCSDDHDLARLAVIADRHRGRITLRVKVGDELHNTGKRVNTATAARELVAVYGAGRVSVEVGR